MATFPLPCTWQPPMATITSNSLENNTTVPHEQNPSHIFLRPTIKIDPLLEKLPKNSSRNVANDEHERDIDGQEIRREVNTKHVELRKNDQPQGKDVRESKSQLEERKTTFCVEHNGNHDPSWYPKKTITHKTWKKKTRNPSPPVKSRTTFRIWTTSLENSSVPSPAVVPLISLNVSNTLSSISVGKKHISALEALKEIASKQARYFNAWKLCKKIDEEIAAWNHSFQCNYGRPPNKEEKFEIALKLSEKKRFNHKKLKALKEEILKQLNEYEIISYDDLLKFLKKQQFDKSVPWPTSQYEFSLDQLNNQHLENDVNDPKLQTDTEDILYQNLVNMREQGPVESICHDLEKTLSIKKLERNFFEASQDKDLKYSTKEENLQDRETENIGDFSRADLQLAKNVLSSVSCISEQIKKVQAELKEHKKNKEKSDKMYTVQEAQLKEFSQKNLELNSLLSKLKNEKNKIMQELLEFRKNFIIMCKVISTNTQTDISPIGRFSVADDCTLLVSKIPKNKTFASTLDIKQTVLLQDGANLEEYEKHSFHRVFHESSNSDIVFESIQSLLSKLFEGKNLCFLALGPKKSGKSSVLFFSGIKDQFSYTGNPELAPGIAPKAVDYIFLKLSAIAANNNDKFTYRTYISIFKFLDTSITDLLLLLLHPNSNKKQPELFLQKDVTTGKVEVLNATRFEVGSSLEIANLIKQALEYEEFFSTEIGSLVFQIQIEMLDQSTYTYTSSKLYFVEIPSEIEPEINLITNSANNEHESLMNKPKSFGRCEMNELDCFEYLIGSNSMKSTTLKNLAVIVKAFINQEKLDKLGKNTKNLEIAPQLYEDGLIKLLNNSFEGESKTVLLLCLNQEEGSIYDTNRYLLWIKSIYN